VFFDLEKSIDRTKLPEPQLLLGRLKEVVVINEARRMPELFTVLAPPGGPDQVFGEVVAATFWGLSGRGKVSNCDLAGVGFRGNLSSTLWKTS
jgi:hypothetical protein